MRRLDRWAKDEKLHRSQLIERVLASCVELRDVMEKESGGLAGLFGPEFESRLEALTERVLSRVMGQQETVRRVAGIVKASKGGGR